MLLLRLPFLRLLWFKLQAAESSSTWFHWVWSCLDRLEVLRRDRGLENFRGFLTFLWSAMVDASSSLSLTWEKKKRDVVMIWWKCEKGHFASPAVTPIHDFAFRNIQDRSFLKVYNKDPAQAFNHTPRAVNGDVRVSTWFFYCHLFLNRHNCEWAAKTILFIYCVALQCCPWLC